MSSTSFSVSARMGLFVLGSGPDLAIGGEARNPAVFTLFRREPAQF
jgi:hypothetical protein